MGFVYPSALGFGRSRILEHVALILRWMPQYSIINRRDIKILCDPRDPCRYALNAFARWDDDR